MTSLLSSHMARSLTTRRLSALMLSLLHRGVSNPAHCTDTLVPHIPPSQPSLADFPLALQLLQCAMVVERVQRD